MDKTLIPIMINVVKDPDGHERFRAVASLEEIVQAPSAGKNMMEIQEAYAALIESCRAKLKIIRENRKKRGDPLLKWELAKSINDFIKFVERKNYFFVNYSKSLSRDLGISVREINYLIEFVNTFPKKNLLHPQISWGKYREILNIKSRSLQKEIIQKILDGELKTRDDIRKFKRTLRK